MHSIGDQENEDIHRIEWDSWIENVHRIGKDYGIENVHRIDYGIITCTV